MHCYWKLFISDRSNCGEDFISYRSFEITPYELWLVLLFRTCLAREHFDHGLTLLALKLSLVKFPGSDVLMLKLNYIFYDSLNLYWFLFSSLTWYFSFNLCKHCWIYHYLQLSLITCECKVFCEQTGFDSVSYFIK